VRQKKLKTHTQGPNENFKLRRQLFKTKCCTKPRVSVYFRAHDIIFFLPVKPTEAAIQQ